LNPKIESTEALQKLHRSFIEVVTEASQKLNRSFTEALQKLHRSFTEALQKLRVKRSKLEDNVKAGQYV
jgi:DNA repair ATPase RecN